MTIRDRFEHSVTLVSGMIIGAAVMYIFDEHRGAQRRARARDKVTHTGHVLGRRLRKGSRDLMNRAVGSVAELRSTLRDRLTPISDDQLLDRVRSQLGHVVSHSGLLQVGVRDGCVMVKGPVREGEIEKIKNRLSRTRGVRECRLDLTPHSDLDRVFRREDIARQQAI